MNKQAPHDSKTVDDILIDKAYVIKANDAYEQFVDPIGLLSWRRAMLFIMKKSCSLEMIGVFL